IVRDSSLMLPPWVNARLLVSDPQNKKFILISKKITAGGMMSFEIVLPKYALTGKYYASLSLNNDISLGNTSFNVEEFIPNKLKVDIRTNTPSADPSHPLSFSVQGFQLYGPPAAGYTLQTSVTFLSRIFTASNF